MDVRLKRVPVRQEHFNRMSFVQIYKQIGNNVMGMRSTAVVATVGAVGGGLLAKNYGVAGAGGAINAGVPGAALGAVLAACVMQDPPPSPTLDQVIYMAKKAKAGGGKVVDAAINTGDEVAYRSRKTGKELLKHARKLDKATRKMTHKLKRKFKLKWH